MKLIPDVDYEFTGRCVEDRREIVALRDMKEVIFGISLEIHQGDLSDGTSVPKWADDLFGLDPLGDSYLYAAWWHDKMYREAKIARWLADYMFFALIMRIGRKNGKFWLKTFSLSLIMLISVRIGGKTSYEQSKLSRIEQERTS